MRMTDPTANAAKLLPCPFCEGSAEMQPFKHMHYAMCFACGAKGSLQPSIEKAATAWNTRPQPAPCAHEWKTLQDGSIGCRKCLADKLVWEAVQL